MISLDVDEIYIADLHDDFIMNYNYDLYQFIGKDPVKAFYLAVHIAEWFSELEKNQKYLYSKQIRHNKEKISHYLNQFEFWSGKFQSNQDEEVYVIDLSEYILNNMFWDKEEDIIYMAFWLGTLLYQQSDKKSILQLDKNNKLIKEWDSIDAITEEFNKNSIIKCCEGQQQSHKGYIWKYKDE